MILKSIRLTNIRSYDDETIEFPPGVTLFEGDMGSGKSTILMAIEFALFGLGSEKGAGLLRLGEKEGGVQLRFDVDGVEHEVSRTLKRKANSVQQEPGYLLLRGEKLQLSPTELKEKVLKTLNFNEPVDPKAQSVIYRYAIFTPQEEMKAILNYRPDVRLQTLRKAFRLEDYRVAADNAALISTTLHKKAIELDGKTADLEDIKNRASQLAAQIRAETEELAEKEREEKKLEEELAHHREELKKHERERLELSKVLGSIPLIERQLGEKGTLVAEIAGEIKELERRSNELKEKAESLKKEAGKQTDKTVEQLNIEVSRLEKEERDLLKKESLLNSKIKEYEAVEKNRTCPTCDRPVDPAEFTERIREKTAEREGVERKHSECYRQLEEAKRAKVDLEKHEAAKKDLENWDHQVASYEADIGRKKERINRLKVETSALDLSLRTARAKLGELQEVSQKITSLERRIAEIDTELKSVRREAAESHAKIDAANKNFREYRQRIEEKEKQRCYSEALKDCRIWLDEYFAPTVAAIEKQALISLNQEFNQEYQKWYNLMVEDPSKESRVDEEFSPIVEQDGYEQNITYLSGGEKTSVALAYRLALNGIVQKVSIGMKSNLLILDEPTDGFSKVQLFKIREIIDEIKCPQLIMVSHERELESFADHVIRVEKSRGISRIIAE